MSRPRNILLIMTDQQRSTALGCAGQEQVSTPNLDVFARQGIRYTNAVSNTPACTPARASLLTGKHVFQHGLVNNELSLGSHHTSLAHALNGTGYDCAYIGKWHVDGVNRGAFIPPGPRRQGFDHYWAGTECNHNYFAGYYYDESGAPVWFDTYEPEGQTDLAIEYVRNRGVKKPFCLALSWGPPHCPYHLAPKRFRDMYPPESIALRPNAVEARVQNRGVPLSTEEADAFKKRQIAGYYAHCSALDACFGRMMATLDELGLSEDTLVIFTSDHGDMLFSQDRGWKTKPWRESVGIPLLMRWPGQIAAGQESRLPISLVDLMPTVLGVVGAPIPDGVQGLDLSWHPLGRDGTVPESSFINYVVTSSAQRHKPWRGVVTERYTYAETREGVWVMYDDIADPYQMNNLADNPAAAELRQHLHSLVAEWLAKTDDDFADSLTVAERYMQGRHVDCAIPVTPLEPIIEAGQAARKATGGSYAIT